MLPIGGAAVAVLMAACQSTRTRALPPDPGSQLRLEAPVDRWQDALPLGNGELGGLLWGGDRLLLAIDRGDLWDLRAAADSGADAPFPTKLPATRLVFDLGDNGARSFQLDIVDAVATARLDHGQADAFIAAEGAVAMMNFEQVAPTPRIVRPPALDALGYPAARRGGDESSTWMVQDGTGGGQWAIVAAWRDAPGVREVAVAVATRGDGLDPLAVARERVADALADGYPTTFLRHRVWWHDFWAGSRVTLPDDLQASYDRAKYLATAGAHIGSAPLSPQGPWTGNSETLPPNKGAYRFDGDTPLAQSAAHTAGLRGLDQSYLEWNWRQLSRYREFAQNRNGVAGASVPTIVALDGRCANRAGDDTPPATNAAWVAHAFYLHWRYTQDPEFLRDRAYPFCHAVAEALLARAVYHGDTLRLAGPDSPGVANDDQALALRLFAALYQMARARSDDIGAARWHAVLAALEELDTGTDGALTLAHDKPYESGRGDLRHALAIYPLGVLDAQQPRDQPLINASLDHILECGFDGWTSTTHAWLACLLARGGRGSEALAQLHAFRDQHAFRNGMHWLNDESELTVTGNLLAMQAVHEMLLQSHGGAIAVFPAVPDDWSDVSFHNLNAEGGYWISARRINGRTAEISIIARQKGVLRLVDPFAQHLVLWTSAVKTHDGICEIHLDKYQKVSGRLLY